jgi:hypothetical protein
MDEEYGTIIMFTLIDSLDLAFLARQQGDSSREDSWGGQFFTILEQEHPGWLT